MGRAAFHVTSFFGKQAEVTGFDGSAAMIAIAKSYPSPLIIDYRVVGPEWHHCHDVLSQAFPRDNSDGATPLSIATCDV
jgi:hypothetical protein